MTNEEKIDIVKYSCNQLPEPFRTNIKSYVDAQRFFHFDDGFGLKTEDELSLNLNVIINMGFTWAHTTQGRFYWESVQNINKTCR